MVAPHNWPRVVRIELSFACTRVNSVTAVCIVASTELCAFLVLHELSSSAI